MMMNLIGDPKLFVMQVEMDIYSVLKRVSPIQSVMLFITSSWVQKKSIIHYMNEFHIVLSQLVYLKGYQNGFMK